MPRQLARVLACVILLFTSWAGVQAAPAPRASGEGVGELQILVMLRLPPPHFHSDGVYGSGWDVQSGKRARWRIAEKLAQRHHLKVVDNWNMSAIGVDCFVMQRSAAGSPDRASTGQASTDQPSADQPSTDQPSTGQPSADQLSTGQPSADQLVKQLSAAPEVESVQVVNTFRTLQAVRDPLPGGAAAPSALGQHNDPLFEQQPTSEPWHLAELHRSATGRGVTIAVIDSSVDLQHADLRGQVRLARDFVGVGSTSAEAHGTAVAGIIAARADDGIGIAGIAPGARLLALRACWDEGRDGEASRCNSFMLAKALHFAIDEEADVINLSLSGPQDALLARLLDVALARGTSVVAALAPPGVAQTFPASHPGVIAVGMAGQRSPFRGVNAPGRDVPTTLPGGQWGLVSGSSFSAAEVSGLIALLRELSGPLQHAPVLFAQDANFHTTSVQADERNLDSCALARHAAKHCVCQCSKDGDPARTPRPST